MIHWMQWQVSLIDKDAGFSKRPPWRVISQTVPQPISPWEIFLSFISNCLSYFTTAKISFTYSLYSQFTHMIFIIYTARHSLHTTGINWTHSLALDLLAARLHAHSSVGRASHRYREGHGLEFRWSLRIFSGLFCKCLSYFTTAKMFFHFYITYSYHYFNDSLRN